MIAIVNINPTDKLDGEQLYSVRINQTELFKFKHIREQPISKCFERAMLVAIEIEKNREAFKDFLVFDQLNVHRQDW